MGDMEHKQKCAEINVYCGDKDHKKKKECCDPCRAVDSVVFVGTSDASTVLIPVATEIPLSLLVNPAGSGKNLVIHRRLMSVLGSDDHASLFKFYLDPTLISQGVLGSTINLNTSLIALSGAQFYTAPIPSANGQLIDAFNVGVLPFESNEVIVLGEGHSILVTGRANAEDVKAAAFIYFNECMIEVMQPTG